MKKDEFSSFLGLNAVLDQAIFKNKKHTTSLVSSFHGAMNIIMFFGFL